MTLLIWKKCLHRSSALYSHATRGSLGKDKSKGDRNRKPFESLKKELSSYI